MSSGAGCLGGGSPLPVDGCAPPDPAGGAGSGGAVLFWAGTTRGGDQAADGCSRSVVEDPSRNRQAPSGSISQRSGHHGTGAAAVAAPARPTGPPEIRVNVSCSG